jgi:hypothetical protein
VHETEEDHHDIMRLVSKNKHCVSKERIKGYGGEKANDL